MLEKKNEILEEKFRKSEETINALVKIIQNLETIIQRMDNEDRKTSTGKNVQEKTTDGWKASGMERAPERVTKPLAPTQVWQGKDNKPDWIRIGQKGKPVRDKQEMDKRVRKKTMSQEDIERFAKGLPPKQKGLKFLYIKGVPRWKYSQIRIAMSSWGIQPNWVRNIANVEKETMELLVFEERKEEICEILRNKTEYEIDATFEVTAGDRQVLKNTEARIKRQLGTIPEQMFTVKKTIGKQLTLVQVRLLEIEEEEKEGEKSTLVTEEMDIVAEVTEGDLTEMEGEPEAMEANTGRESITGLDKTQRIDV